MGISIGELKPSTAIIYNDDLYNIIDCEHAKLGRGAAFCRVKIKNLKTGQIRECTLRDSDNVEIAYIEKRKLQYLYASDIHYHFMDLETYEDLVLDEFQIKDKVDWLKDNLELIGLYFENKLLDLEIPLSLELKVVDTMPGYRGNTVKAGTKPAKLETGLVINVPLFINNGDILKVDTRTREYLARK
ncbi:MAG: elongation factor P [Candidatus Omnitrophica bacterium]|nr:elongation factor P [Candidatus Omnitrophota bacterium]